MSSPLVSGGTIFVTKEHILIRLLKKVCLLAVVFRATSPSHINASPLSHISSTCICQNLLSVCNILFCHFISKKQTNRQLVKANLRAHQPVKACSLLLPRMKASTLHGMIDKGVSHTFENEGKVRKHHTTMLTG